MKTNEEMKKVNEEILALWRGIGFLRGLKEGSINEWRCAKSYQDMSQYCLEHKDENSALFDTIMFPIIRRCICTGKYRVHRSLKPEEIVEHLESINMGEMVDIIDITSPIKGKVGLKAFSRKLTRNFLEKVIGKEISCKYLIDNIEKYEKEIKMFSDITGCDFEAELCVYFSELLSYKMCYETKLEKKI